MDFKELLAYKKAFALAMSIYQISKAFPKEEKYSLTDQIRRSSRSTCANMTEAYRKRIYPKHLISKRTDSDAENSETIVWIDFALECRYVDVNTRNTLSSECIEIGKLLNYMIGNPEKFGSSKNF